MAHAKLGRILKMGGAAEAALDPLAEARGRFQKLGDVGDLDLDLDAAGMAMASLADSGDCLQELGRLDEAAAVYEASTRLAEELGDRRSGAVARGQLGTVRILQQKYDDALSAYHEARKTFELLGEPWSVAVAWHQIGLVYQQSRQYEAAEHAYQQSLKITVQLGDRSGEAATLNQLGGLYRLTSRWEDAVRFFRQAVETYTEIGDLSRWGFCRSGWVEARQLLVRRVPFGTRSRQDACAPSMRPSGRI